MTYQRIAAILFLLLPVSAWAGDMMAPAPGNFTPGAYWNLHVANTSTSLNEGNQDFTYMNIGGVVGYRFSEVLSGELFGTFGVTPKRDDITSFIIGQEVKTRFDAVGLFAVAQTRGDAYFKGRLGLVQSRFIYSASGYQDESGNTVGLGYGIGGGFMRGGVRFEVEYLVLPTVDDPLYTNTTYDSKQLLISFGMPFN